MNCPLLETNQGLVGYWNFEEGSGYTIFDQTNNGNNGILNGAADDSNVSISILSINKYQWL